MSLEIEAVEAMHLNPGDVLVVHVAADASLAEVARLSARLAQTIPDHKHLILSPSLGIQALNAQLANVVEREITR